jgi:hypothetical protein
MRPRDVNVLKVGLNPVNDVKKLQNGEARTAEPSYISSEGPAIPGDGGR